MNPINKPIGETEICQNYNITFPPQHQDRQPGLQYIMEPLPISDITQQPKKLQGKVAIITGGDSGIGRSTAIAFAKNGANVVIVYLYEQEDACETKKQVEAYGQQCLAIAGDLRDPQVSQKVVEMAIQKFGKIDILVNNCAVQFVQDSLLNITPEQLLYTFETNIFTYFYMTQAVLPHLKKGSSIINTASITAYAGEKKLIDYSATKGAIVSFTRSLSQSLIDQGIRVNGVAPGPTWTPLIPSSYSAEEVATFGSYTSQVPMNRAGEPYEIASCYLFLASDDASYMSGQILHPNGGTIVGS